MATPRRSRRISTTSIRAIQKASLSTARRLMATRFARSAPVSPSSWVVDSEAISVVEMPTTWPELKVENWDELKREMLAFPLPKAHDDLIDALSMVAHLVTVIYSKPDDSEEYEVVDDICGF